MAQSTTNPQYEIEDLTRRTAGIARPPPSLRQPLKSNPNKALDYDDERHRSDEVHPDIAERVMKRINRTIASCVDESFDDVEYSPIDLVARNVDEVLLLRRFRYDQQILKQSAVNARLTPVRNGEREPPGSRGEPQPPSYDEKKKAVE